MSLHLGKSTSLAPSIITDVTVGNPHAMRTLLPRSSKQSYILLRYRTGGPLPHLNQSPKTQNAFAAVKKTALGHLAHDVRKDGPRRSDQRSHSCQQIVVEQKALGTQSIPAVAVQQGDDHRHVCTCATTPPPVPKPPRWHPGSHPQANASTNRDRSNVAFSDGAA